VPTIQSFEELKAWKAARTLVQQVYRCSNAGTFRRDFALRDQIRRAAVSILSNIAEGFERGGNAEFCRFLSMAKGSSGEVRAQLYVALDQEYLSAAQFAGLQQQVLEISRMLSGLMTYLHRSEFKGTRFK
jgi:four helix bundle protein